jgi:aconitate hydratase
MEPRYLNVVAVIVKSFARIHETNLKKQGILTLTFSDKEDYNKIKENDKIDIIGLKEFRPGKQLTLVLNHSDGSKEDIKVYHSYNKTQIEWFKAGSALNLIRKSNEQST